MLKFLSRLIVGLFQGRHLGQCRHRPLPSIGEPALGIFDQRIPHYGFFLGSMALMGSVHTIVLSFLLVAEQWQHVQEKMLTGGYIYPGCSRITFAFKRAKIADISFWPNVISEKAAYD
jgi:hypothetical protein